MRNLTTPPAKLEARAQGGALYLYGFVGEGLGEGFTATDVQKALAARPAGPLTVYVNSRGGDFFVGQAVAAQLRRLSESGTKVTAVIDGEASSAAATIVAACDRVEAMPGASMLLHKVRAAVMGSASDLRALANDLDAAQPSMTAVLCRKTGKSPAEMDAILDEDRIHSTDELLAMHMVDAVHGESSKPKTKTALSPTTIEGFAALAKSRHEALQMMDLVLLADQAKK